MQSEQQISHDQSITNEHYKSESSSNDEALQHQNANHGNETTPLTQMNILNNTIKLQHSKHKWNATVRFNIIREHMEGSDVHMNKYEPKSSTKYTWSCGQVKSRPNQPEVQSSRVHKANNNTKAT
jgi:hypothetical protein